MKNLFKNTFPLGKKQPNMNIQKMEKKKIHKPKNQFPQTGIRFPFEKLLPSNFQNFIRALNKRITFPLNRKLLSILRNEEVQNIHFSPGGKAVFTARILSNGRNCFHKPEKQLLLGAMKFSFKNWLPHSFDFHQQNTLDKKYTISPKQKKDFTAFVSASGNHY